VHIIALDFSKAFDTVRHHTFLSKFGRFHNSNNLYTWLDSYFAGRAHSTKVQGSISQNISVNASIIQESSIGLSSYVINASDRKTALIRY